MNSLNSIILEGNVVRDPSIRATPKGTSVCTFSLASNRAYRTENGYDKEVSYFNVETWGKLAEQCGKNCPKGRGVRVVGRLKQTRWTDDVGNKQSKIYVIAEHVEFKPKFNKQETSNSDESNSPKEMESEFCQQKMIAVEAEAVPAF